MENMLTYKGHPVMRKDNLIYFGSVENKYIIVIKVLESAKEGSLDMATKLSIELQLNDPDISMADRVQKTAQRNGLYEAMDVAVIWLERTLSGK